MRFSLVCVDREKDGFVDGAWMQDFTGTLEEASQWARETERANSNRISVAVVEDMYYTPFSNVYGVKRLDRAPERDWRSGTVRKDMSMNNEKSADNKSMQWEKYNISYERNGVYQTLFVKAPSAEVAGNYFLLRKPDATICGVSKATGDDERPGKPELTAKLYEVWKDCELGQTYKEKSFLTAQEADEWIAENERCYPGWHLRVVTVEEKKLSLDDRIKDATRRAEGDLNKTENTRDDHHLRR